MSEFGENDSVMPEGVENIFGDVVVTSDVAHLSHRITLESGPLIVRKKVLIN